MRFPIYSLLFSTLVATSVVAAHSSTTNSHARRSLTKSNDLPRRQLGNFNLGDVTGALNGIVGGLTGNNGDDQDNNGTQSPAANDPSITSSGSATSTPESTPTSVSESTPVSSTETEPSSTQPAPTTSSSENGGVLGPVTGILGPLTSVVGVGASAVTSILGPTSFPPTSVSESATETTAPTTTSDPSSSVTVAPTSSGGGGIISGIGSGLSSVLSSILDPTPTPDPTTSDSLSTDPPATSSSSGGGILPTLSGILSSILDPSPTPDPTITSTSSDGGILPTLSSILSSVLDPTPTPDPPATSISSSGGILPTLSSILSSVLDPSPTAEPTTSDPVTVEPTVTLTSSSGGIIPSLSSIISSVLDPTPTSVPPTSEPDTPSTSDSPTDGPTSQPTSEISTGPPTSVPTSEPPISNPPTSVPTSEPPVTDPTSVPTSIPTSIPTSVIISFPTSADVSSTGVSGSETTTDAPTPTTTISINSDLSFILTESSLAFESIPSTSTEHTLTDPDQATTTVDSQPLSAATTLSVAPLPTGIPGRIYPKIQLDTNQDLSSYTIISILFNQELNWPFVVQNQVSSSQIFAYLPVIIATALNIPVAEIKTWALQVYVPSSYKSPADSIQLGTMWLGYIPSDQVDTLAAEIKTKQSAFYTGVPDGVAKALASHVNSGFNINSVADPNVVGGEPGAIGSSAASDNGKSRQDAIIGVVSALGAIALLVLVFLVYRSMKRRRELAHRRLSDPPDAGAFVIGARPEGREFDQDSVGGARRRSFYYAEDSLRGFQGERNDENHYDSRTSPTMSQRRNVAPATISAPILQQSSMNW